jgi:single-strand DNA-binding protein
MSVNKVILVGNVGKDPEVRYLEGGTAVCSFPLATSETYRNRDGDKVTTTEWHNVVLWRGLAEIAEKYVRKGSQLYIEGKIRTRSWDDRDGNKRYTTEVIADTMQMLGKRTEEAQQQQPVAGGSGNQQAAQDKSRQGAVRQPQSLQDNEQPAHEETGSGEPEIDQVQEDDLPF